GDVGEFQGFGICPVSVAIVAFQKCGPIGENFVEIFFVGERRGEHGVVPASTEYPIVAGMSGAVCAQTLLDVGGVLGAFEIDATEAERAVDEVNVAVSEAGQDQSAL